MYSAWGGCATLAGALLLVGCSSDVCGDDCTEGVSCNQVLDVPADYSLEEASSQARSGDCIALTAGTYGEATLHGGVSLLGPGAAQATVGSITLLEGDGAVIRRLQVAGVVKLRPAATGVRLDSLRVTGSQNGVQAEAGASFTLVDSVLSGVPDNGVLAVDAASVVVQRTTIEAGGGPGIWAQCTAGCDCTTRPEVELTDVQIVGNLHTGVALLGVNATLERVEIRDTGQREQELTANGGGLVASACTSLDAFGLTVDGSMHYGMLVDSSSGTLGAPGEDQGIIIIDSRGGGIWLQHIGNAVADQAVTLENVTMTANASVGLNIGGGSRGIIIIDSRVGDTTSSPTQALDWVDATSKANTGLDSIGDGLIWGMNADAQIDGLTLSGNDRSALLIDGPVTGSISNVTLASGDEAKGIVQQHVGSAAEGPTMGSGAPALSQLADAPWTTAEAPEPPNASR